MSEPSAIDLVFKWHDLATSQRRKIAAIFGVPPQGATPHHLWTMQVIDAACERGELDILKAEIAAADLRS